VFREYEQTTSFFNSIQREIPQVPLGCVLPQQAGDISRTIVGGSEVVPGAEREKKVSTASAHATRFCKSSGWSRVSPGAMPGSCIRELDLRPSSPGCIKNDRIDPDRRCLIALERRGRDIAELVAVLVVPVTYNGSEIIQAPA
jgi:hypothetical protein